MCSASCAHSVRVCVCVCSDCGMCSHSQTNNGSLPATIVRERIGLRESERLSVYRVSLWCGVPPSGPFGHCTIPGTFAYGTTIACILNYLC